MSLHLSRTGWVYQSTYHNKKIMGRVAIIVMSSNVESAGGRRFNTWRRLLRLSGSGRQCLEVVNLVRESTPVPTTATVVIMDGNPAREGGGCHLHVRWGMVYWSPVPLSQPLSPVLCTTDRSSHKAHSETLVWSGLCRSRSLGPFLDWPRGVLFDDLPQPWHYVQPSTSAPSQLEGNAMRLNEIPATGHFANWIAENQRRHLLSNFQSAKWPTCLGDLGRRSDDISSTRTRHWYHMAYWKVLGHFNDWTIERYMAALPTVWYLISENGLTRQLKRIQRAAPVLESRAAWSKCEKHV